MRVQSIASEASLEGVQVLAIGTGQVDTHVLSVQKLRVRAIQAVILGRPEAGQTSRTAQLTKSGGLIHIIRGIDAFEAVVTSRAIGTAYLARLACMRGGVGIEGQRAGGLATGVVEEHWSLTLGTICGVYAVQAMHLA